MLEPFARMWIASFTSARTKSAATRLLDPCATGRGPGEAALDSVRGAAEPAAMPRRHLFVTGLPRSGTTLVANLLGSQPRITLRPDALGGALSAAQRLGGFDRQLNALERNVALSWVDFETQGRPEASALSHLRPDGFRTVGELYHQALEAVAHDDDAVVGHKVNGHGPHTDVFWWLLEQTDVFALCVVRDLRDVVLSQRNHLHRRLSPFDHYRTLARRLPELRAHPRCIVLRFEDLLRDRRAALRPLERTLEIELDADPPQLFHGGQPWLENSAFHDIERPFDTRALQRWREHRDDPLVREAAFRCSAALQRLGYSCERERFTLGERLRFTRHELQARGVRALGALGRELRQLAQTPAD
jgi:hypothetical protein